MVKSVYKLCPVALYSVVISHCSILLHDALHDCLSSNSCLENGEREGILSATAQAVKTLRLYFLGSMVTLQQANSSVHYLTSGYIIY